MPSGTPQTLFLIQLACTLFMTGLIWFVQIVHYPLFATLFATAGPTAFPLYEQLHARRTGWVVFSPMLLELLTAFAALLPSLRPPQVSRSSALASATLVLIIWLSTALLQIPLHDTLSHAPTPAVIHRLVLTNWLRTAAWTARSTLLLITIARALNNSPSPLSF